jgi:hypothetical protein
VTLRIDAAVQLVGVADQIRWPPGEWHCPTEGATDGVRTATRSRASESPWEGEGRMPEQPDPSENTFRGWGLDGMDGEGNCEGPA